MSVMGLVLEAGHAKKYAKHQIKCGSYPVMGQLQCDLDEGIRTGAALLNQTFAKVIEGENVRVDVVSQSRGDCQRALNDFLALQETAKI